MRGRLAFHVILIRLAWADRPARLADVTLHEEGSSEFLLTSAVRRSRGLSARVISALHAAAEAGTPPPASTLAPDSSPQVVRVPTAGGTGTGALPPRRVEVLQVNWNGKANFSDVGAALRHVVEVCENDAIKRRAVTYVVTNGSDAKRCTHSACGTWVLQNGGADSEPTYSRVCGGDPLHCTLVDLARKDAHLQRGTQKLEFRCGTPQCQTERKRCDEIDDLQVEHSCLESHKPCASTGVVGLMVTRLETATDPPPPAAEKAWEVNIANGQYLEREMWQLGSQVGDVAISATGDVSVQFSESLERHLLSASSFSARGITFEGGVKLYFVSLVKQQLMLPHVALTDVRFVCNSKSTLGCAMIQMEEGSLLVARADVVGGALNISAEVAHVVLDGIVAASLPHAGLKVSLCHGKGAMRCEVEVINSKVIQPGKEGYVFEVGSGHLVLRNLTVVNSSHRGVEVAMCKDYHNPRKDCDIDIENLRIERSGNNGLYIWEEGIETTLNMKNVTISESDSTGAWLRLGTNADVTCEDLNIWGNGYGGMDLDVKSGEYKFNVSRAEVSWNKRGGLVLAGHAKRAGKACSVTLADIFAEYNSGQGVEVDRCNTVDIKRLSLVENKGVGLLLQNIVNATIRDLNAEKNAEGCEVVNLGALALKGRISLIENVNGLHLQEIKSIATSAIWHVVRNGIGVMTFQVPPFRLRGVIHLNNDGDVKEAKISGEVKKDQQIDCDIWFDNWDLLFPPPGRKPCKAQLDTSWILRFRDKMVFWTVVMLTALATTLLAALPIMAWLRGPWVSLLVVASVSLLSGLLFLAWYNLVLWNEAPQIWRGACFKLNIFVLALCISSMPAIMMINYSLTSIVKAAQLEVQANLGKEEALKIIDASDFRVQRRSVEAVNKSYTIKMDEMYAERQDSEKGYRVDQIVDQDRIVNRVIRGTVPVDKPWALFLAGGPGSGKGTVVRYLRELKVLPKTVAVIDLDDLRMQLPAYNSQPNKVIACQKTQAQAGYMTEVAAHWCAEEKVCFINDACLSGLQWHRHYFGFLREKRVRLVILLVDTDVEVCLKRVKSREEQTGRPVPESLVRGKNKECRENAKLLEDEVLDDKSRLVDLVVRVKNETSEQVFVDEAGNPQPDALETLRRFLNDVHEDAPKTS